MLEATLLVSWFIVETQPDVPFSIKMSSLVILGVTLTAIFWVSEAYTDSLNSPLKSIFLVSIFCRCLARSGIVQERKRADDENKKDALLDVETLKKQLIQKAYAKHNLALAQLNARLKSQLKNLEDGILTSQEGHHQATEDLRESDEGFSPLQEHEPSAL